jgi:hypothetical protein
MGKSISGRFANSVGLDHSRRQASAVGQKRTFAVSNHVDPLIGSGAREPEGPLPRNLLPSSAPTMQPTTGMTYSPAMLTYKPVLGTMMWFVPAIRRKSEYAIPKQAAQTRGRLVRRSAATPTPTTKKKRK